MLALEPRLLFDGAAAATADQQQEQQAQQALAAATEQAASDTGDLPLSPTAEGGGAAPAGRELLVVDTRIPDWQALVGEVRPNVQVLLLDANADPLAQVAAAIGDQPVAGIHLLAHGDPGALRLGGLVLDRQGIDRYATELAQLGAGLAADGDILLYGCETGKGEAGRLLIEALARVTGADVAASTNLTGAARLGGDWVLEARAGIVDATAFASADALAAFDRLLALPVVDLNSPALFVASDNFAAQSYTGGTGWTSGWQEFDASPDGGGDSNNSPTGKNVQLVAAGGGGFEAVFIGHGNQVPRDFLQRSINLLPYTSATLSFTYRMAAVEAGDTVSVEVSTNGGASFTVVDVLPTSTTNVSRSYDISGLISDRMVIRFGTNTGFTDADDRFFFDNVVVTADGNNFDASYVEDGTPANIAAATATVTDPDGSQIQGAVITVANLQAGDLLTPGALPTGITASGAGTTITLSGLASAEDYATAIRNITYSTTSDTPNTKVVREITVRVTDATGEQSGASRAFIRVANADDTMSAAPDAFDVASFGSFAGNVIADNGAGPDTDPDGTLTVSTTLVSAPTRGTVVMNADGTFTYTVNAGFVGTDFTDTFQYRLQSLSQVPGVTYQFWDSVPAGNSLATGFPTTPPDLTGFSTSYNVDIPALAFGGTNPLDNFTVRFSSELEVTTGGTYTFTTGSDDGSILRVDGVIVVSNDGAHSFQERSGSIFLAPGRYTLQVDFFEVGGQEDLQVYYQGPDTLGVRTDLDGAVGLLAPTFATGTVTVNGFAAAPRLDLDGSAAGSGFATTWTDPPGSVRPIADTDVTITDTNSANLTGATVTLVNAQPGDVLIAGAMPGGITATVSGNVVTLSGTASLAAYQTALRAISFDNTAANPVTTTRTVNVVVTDGTYDSNTAVASIAIVSPNDAPTAVGDTVATIQNTPVTFDVRANDSDPEGQPLAVTQINGTAIAVGGTVTLAGVGTVLRNADGTLTFTPNAGYSGTPSFAYTVSDGSLTATATVNVSVNAPPTLDLDASAAGTGYTTTFTELGAAVAVVDTDVAIGDPNAGDSLTFATVTLLNAQPGDVLSIAGALPAGITAGLAGNVLTLSGTASRASYQTALQAVRFGNPGSTAGSARSVQVLVFDGTSYSNAAQRRTRQRGGGPPHDPRGHAARGHRRVGHGRGQQSRFVPRPGHGRRRLRQPGGRGNHLRRHERHGGLHDLRLAGADQRSPCNACLHAHRQLQRRRDGPADFQRRRALGRRHLHHQRRGGERRPVRREQHHHHRRGRDARVLRRQLRLHRCGRHARQRAAGDRRHHPPRGRHAETRRRSGHRRSGDPRGHTRQPHLHAGGERQRRGLRLFHLPGARRRGHRQRGRRHRRDAQHHHLQRHRGERPPGEHGAGGAVDRHQHGARARHGDRERTERRGRRHRHADRHPAGE